MGMRANWSHNVCWVVSYVLSVAYQGTVVLIENDDMPQYVLPVRRRNIYVVPFDQPVIEQIATTEGENQPINADSVLRILGRNLRGDITMVRIDGIDVVP